MKSNEAQMNNNSSISIQWPCVHEAIQQALDGLNFLCL